MPAPSQPQSRASPRRPSAPSSRSAENLSPNCLLQPDLGQKQVALQRRTTAKSCAWHAISGLVPAYNAALAYMRSGIYPQRCLPRPKHPLERNYPNKFVSNPYLPEAKMRNVCPKRAVLGSDPRGVGLAPGKMRPRLAGVAETCHNPRHEEPME